MQLDMKYKRNDRLFLFFSGPGGTVANRWRTAADTGIYLVLYFFFYTRRKKEKNRFLSIHACVRGERRRIDRREIRKNGGETFSGRKMGGEVRGWIFSGAYNALLYANCSFFPLIIRV